MKSPKTSKGGAASKSQKQKQLSPLCYKHIDKAQTEELLNSKSAEDVNNCLVGIFPKQTENSHISLFSSIILDFYCSFVLWARDMLTGAATCDDSDETGVATATDHSLAEKFSAMFSVVHELHEAMAASAAATVAPPQNTDATNTESVKIPPAQQPRPSSSTECAAPAGDTDADAASSLAENLLKFQEYLRGAGCQAVTGLAAVNTTLSDTTNSKSDGGGGGGGGGGLELLTYAETQAFISHLMHTWYQHYNLWRFVYGFHPAHEVIGVDLFLNAAPDATTPFPAPLNEGLPVRLFNEIGIPRSPPTMPIVNTGGSTLSNSKAGGAGATGGGGGSSKSARDKSRAQSRSSDEAATAAKTAAEVAGDDATALNEFEQNLLRDCDKFAVLSPGDISKALNEVCQEMLGGLETEFLGQLQEREASLLTRINKIHITSIQDSQQNNQ